MQDENYRCTHLELSEATHRPRDEETAEEAPARDSTFDQLQ
jgi:hypothetical protein